MRYTALMHGEQTMPRFVHMLDSVRTGTPVPMLHDGRSQWEQFAEDPERSEIFNRAMRGRAPALAAAAKSVDWSGVRTVVDIGGLGSMGRFDATGIFILPRGRTTHGPGAKGSA